MTTLSRRQVLDIPNQQVMVGNLENETGMVRGSFEIELDAAAYSKNVATGD